MNNYTEQVVASIQKRLDSESIGELAEVLLQKALEGERYPLPGLLKLLTLATESGPEKDEVIELRGRHYGNKS